MPVPWISTTYASGSAVLILGLKIGHLLPPISIGCMRMLCQWLSQKLQLGGRPRATPLPAEASLPTHTQHLAMLQRLAGLQPFPVQRAHNPSYLQPLPADLGLGWPEAKSAATELLSESRSNLVVPPGQPCCRTQKPHPSRNRILPEWGACHLMPASHDSLQAVVV